MTAKDPRKAAYVMGLMAGISILWTANLNGQAIQRLVGTPLPDLPQVASPFELRAINDLVTGKGAFVFEGHEIPPVIRAVPGGTIQLEYVNQMSNSSSEVCVDGPCMNMTNLHFNGLHASPNAPWHVLTDPARENLQGVQARAVTAGTFDRLVNLARS